MTDYAEGSETAGELAPRPLLYRGDATDLYYGGPVTAVETSPAFDPVARPAHYASGAIECADAIAVALGGERDPEVAWCRGNALKYVWRAGKKGDAAEDLRKAIWYLERAVRALTASSCPSGCADAAPVAGGRRDASA